VTRRAWLAFAAVSVLWGVPYLFIRLALEGGMPALFLAWMRIALAAAVVLGMAWHAGVLPQVRGRWRWLVAYAIPEISIPFPMIALGERHVASSVTAIVVSTVPLIVALLALRFDHSERADRRRAAGLVIGFGGVVALVGIDIAGRADELLGAILILVAATGYAIGPMIFKHRLADLDARASMAASLAIAAVVLTPAGLADLPARAPSAGAIAALAALVLLCTVAAFLIFATLVRDVGPGRAAVIAYVAPILAVALGVAALGEHPGSGAIAGLVLILAGSWLATGARVSDLRPRVPAAARERA
jgi:drug/metabolite transporter (DMT)-like permease